MPAERADDLLLDTHALLWWQAGSPRLSSRATVAISTAKRLLVSPVTFWELAMLVEKGRVDLDRPVAVWVRDLLGQERLSVAELTPAIAVAAAQLDAFHGDPADRFIYATARTLQAALVSKDDVLRRYGKERRELNVVW